MGGENFGSAYIWDFLVVILRFLIWWSMKKDVGLPRMPFKAILSDDNDKRGQLIRWNDFRSSESVYGACFENGVQRWGVDGGNMRFSWLRKSKTNRN